LCYCAVAVVVCFEAAGAGPFPAMTGRVEDNGQMEVPIADDVYGIGV